jgi:hypothetical protein
MEKKVEVVGGWMGLQMQWWPGREQRMRNMVQRRHLKGFHDGLDAAAAAANRTMTDAGSTPERLQRSTF